MKKSSLALSITLGISPLLLTGCDVDISQESFLEKLFPNPYDALAIFLAFIVLLVVVFYLAYKPVKALIKKRGDFVEEKIKSANQKELEADDKLAKANEEIKNTKSKAREIVEQAKLDANNERELILNKAKLEREAEVKKTKEEIAQEIEATKDELHREIVSVAIDASSKVLEREINSKDNEKLVDDFIEDLKKGK